MSGVGGLATELICKPIHSDYFAKTPATVGVSRFALFALNGTLNAPHVQAKTITHSQPHRTPHTKTSKARHGRPKTASRAWVVAPLLCALLRLSV